MKAIIIGAGLQGIMTAYFLNREGVEVTVIERRETAGLETSYANGGMLTPSMSDPWNSPGSWKEILRSLGHEDSPLLLRPSVLPSIIGWGLNFLRNSTSEAYRRNTFSNYCLARYSLELMRDIRSDMGTEYDYAPTGTLNVFAEQAGLDGKLALLDQLGMHGLRCEVLTLDQIGVLEPALHDSLGRLTGGIHFPDDETGDAHKFCQLLMQLTAERGVTYRFNTTVNVVSRQNRRLAGVLAGGEHIDADCIVLAAGAYSRALGRALGLSVPVEPVKGYSLTLPSGGWGAVPKIPVVDDDLHAAVVPIGTRLRVAGTAEFAGFDHTLSKGRVANLRKVLLDMYPSASQVLESHPGEAWMGFRPMSPDGVPLIGQTGWSNLFVNTGHGHLGWTMAAGSARLLTDLIMGRDTDLDREPYRPSRF